MSNQEHLLILAQKGALDKVLQDRVTPSRHIVDMYASPIYIRCPLCEEEYSGFHACPWLQTSKD
jgi:hypothetical protein